MTRKKNAVLLNQRLSQTNYRIDGQLTNELTRDRKDRLLVLVSSQLHLIPALNFKTLPFLFCLPRLMQCCRWQSRSIHSFLFLCCFVIAVQFSGQQSFEQLCHASILELASSGIMLWPLLLRYLSASLSVFLISVYGLSEICRLCKNYRMFTQVWTPRRVWALASSPLEMKSK